MDERLDTKHLKELLEERALAQDTLDASRVQEVRDMMERARIRRLQPHFILSFFQAAFKHQGGTMLRREPGRFELTHVPAAARWSLRATSVLPSRRNWFAFTASRRRS